jgi:hypothetical protein
MGIETLAMIGIGLTVAQGIAGAAQAASAAKIQSAAIAANRDAQMQELTIQQQQAREDAEREKGDRAREADREIAALRVIAGETGGLGANFNQGVQEIGYYEGLDIARIESNRNRQIAAADRAKQNVARGAAYDIASVKQQRNAAITNAILGAAQSGVQIYGGYKTSQAKIDAARGKVT